MTRPGPRGRVRNNARRLREAAGLTQAELAFRLARCFGKPFEAVFEFEQ
jgi:DNA-binding XRE family transcriptional regulator